MKNIFLVSLVTFIFLGCSSKQYYEAETTSSIGIKVIDTPSYIKSVNSNGATLDDNRYLDKFGISSKKLKDGFSFINNSNNDIISANKKGEVYINNKHFKFKSNVISASLKGNLLALTFTNNVIGLYDIKSNEFKLKKYLDPSYLNDTRVAMPLFLKNIILYPTLDGKILIVDDKTFQVTKTLTIDPNSEINNIILLENINDTLIVASQNIITSISNVAAIKKELFIQSYTVDEKFIYLATLDGKILKLDKNLDIKQSKKFKFAKFHALAVNKDAIFAIESQGYVVKLSHNFKTLKVDTISFENDEKIFSNKNKIYFEDKLIKF